MLRILLPWRRITAEAIDDDDLRVTNQRILEQQRALAPMIDGFTRQLTLGMTQHVTRRDP